MIELVNVSKKYKTDEENVLNDIFLTFENKGLYFLTGTSGSGKSTLLSILSGIDLSFCGKMLIDGKDIHDFSANELNYYRSVYVGYIFQDYNLIKDLTVYENIKIACEIANVNESEIDVVLEKLNILKLKNKKANSISGGEAQRVAIARCLVKHPKVILADEPTGALDKENGNNIINILSEIAHDYTVIIVTHDQSYVKEDDINYIIQNGNVLTKNNNEIHSDNKFECGNYNKLSLRSIVQFSRKVLIKKKIGLILSMIFIIISTLLFSLSVSAIRYNSKKSAYNEMVENNEYIVTRFGSMKSITSTAACSMSYIEKSKEEVDDDFVYAYTYNSISMDDTNSTLDYFMNSPRTDYHEIQGLAFEYNDLSKHVFGLNVLVGEEALNNNECVVIDTLADSFIELGYKHGYIQKNISNYSDMIGLDIFGYNIVGIVTCSNSNKYKKIFKENKKSGKTSSLLEDAISSGCANSLFIKSTLLKMDTANVSYKYGTSNTNSFSDNYIFNSDTIFDVKQNTSNTISYLGDVLSTNEGVIIGIELFYNMYYGSDYSSRIQFEYELEKLSNPSESDEDAMNNALLKIKIEVLSKINNDDKSFMFEITSNYGEYCKYVTTQIIGIDFETDISSIYVNSSILNEYINDVSKFTNVEALFHKSLDNKKCRNYAYKLMDSSMEWFGDGARLSSEVIINYLEANSTFEVLGYVFFVGGILFLLIGSFIIYKHIIDSILKVERDLGVLKAIGVRTIDIYKILSIQNIIISLITVIFGFILQYLFVGGLNMITAILFETTFKAYYVSIYNYLAIVFLAVLIPLLVTIKPIVLISRKNPKDILNNN